MNRIYKTIRRGLTGQTVVASEHAKGQHKSQSLASHELNGLMACSDYQHLSTLAESSAFKVRPMAAFMKRYALRHSVRMCLLLAVSALFPMVVSAQSSDFIIFGGSGGGGGFDTTGGSGGAGNAVLGGAGWDGGFGGIRGDSGDGGNASYIDGALPPAGTATGGMSAPFSVGSSPNSGGNGSATGGGGGGGGEWNSSSVTGSASGGSTSTFTQTMGNTTYDDVVIEGGNGGGGGHIISYASIIRNLAAGSGGDGGGVSVNAAASLTVANDLSIRAGSGGDGGKIENITTSYPLFAGHGGTGGNAQLNATGKSVVVGGILSVTSGTHGNIGSMTSNSVSGGGSLAIGYGGTGGDAAFIADTLSAPTINLTKNGGALSFTAGTLIVNQNTTLTLNRGTSAGNFDVAVNGLSFSGGNTLTITQVQGTETMAFGGNLFVSGTGNSLNTPIAFDASGKTLTFELPTNLTAGDVLLSSNSDIKLTGSSVAMTVASVGGAPGTLNSLNTGDQITLIAGIDQSTWSGSQSKVTTSGGAIDYTFDLGTSQQGAIWNLVSTLQDEQFNDGKAHNALMSASAMHLLLAEGSDRVASVTSRFMPSVSPLNQGNDIQRGVFMDMSGGHAKMKTGSHVKSNNFHLLAGPGIRLNQLNDAKTDLGFFLEAGRGNFDTYNSLYRGNGDTSYYGAGLLARHEMGSGLYGEASLRIGRAKSEYDSAYQTNFDIKSTYYGGHLGLGYILPVSEQGSLDLSAKLLYTHLEGGSDINESGDRMSVGNTDSTRSQLGVQYNHQLSNNVNAFARAVWDYEFDGKTNGSYSQYSISQTNPSGSTGIFSLGANVKPSANKNLSVDLKLNGYTGKREGVGANVMVNYAF